MLRGVVVFGASRQLRVWNRLRRFESTDKPVPEEAPKQFGLKRSDGLAPNEDWTDIERDVSYRKFQEMIEDENLPDLQETLTGYVDSDASDIEHHTDPFVEPKVHTVLPMSAEEEARILGRGFPDYVTALGTFLKRAIPVDALGQGWIPLSVGSNKSFKSASWPEGKLHWADEDYERSGGIIVVRVSEENVGRVLTLNETWREKTLRQYLLLDLQGRKLHAMEVVTVDREEEGEAPPLHACYALSSGWTSALKGLRWPRNYTAFNPLLLLPVNDSPIEDLVLKEYPLTFSHAQKF